MLLISWWEKGLQDNKKTGKHDKDNTIVRVNPYKLLRTNHCGVSDNLG